MFQRDDMHDDQAYFTICEVVKGERQAGQGCGYAAGYRNNAIISTKRIGNRYTGSQKTRDAVLKELGL